MVCIQELEKLREEQEGKRKELVHEWEKLEQEEKQFKEKQMALETLVQKHELLENEMEKVSSSLTTSSIQSVTVEK